MGDCAHALCLPYDVCRFVVRTQAERDADGHAWRQTTGRDVARFAERHLGVHLTPWQQQLLDDAFRASAAEPEPRRRWWHRYTRRNP